MLKVQRVSDSSSLSSLTSKPHLISVRESVAKTPKKASVSPTKKHVKIDASVLKDVQNTRSKSAVRLDSKKLTSSPKRNASPSRNNTTTLRVEGQPKLPS